MAHYSTMPLIERARYAPETIDNQELIEALEDLAKYRDIGGCDYPEGLAEEYAELEDREEKPKDYDDYKSFFDDVVSSMEDYCGRWPCASPSDQNLLQAVCDEFRLRDEYQTALVNIRSACEAGDTLEYILSFIPGEVK